jgi:2-polyprenyl-6-methoxyphenol hydroxylase-like FAD-dependent oxidoreductase
MSKKLFCIYLLPFIFPTLIGLRSTVSQFVVRGDTSPEFSEHEAFYGVLDESNDAAGNISEDTFPKSTISHFFEGGSYFGTFPSGGPGGTTRSWLLISQTPFEIDPSRDSSADVKAALREKTSLFMPEIRHLVLSTPAEECIHTGLYHRAPFHKWFEGNVVLMGDAVHVPLPYTGQGANLAMEDAYVLARSIALNETNNYAAFKEYQNLRMERCAKIVHLGDLFSRLELKDNHMTNRLHSRTHDSGSAHPSVSLLKHLEAEMLDDCPVPEEPDLNFNSAT